MMVEVTYQMVLSTIQTAGILVGIAYYVMNLNYTRKNQEISLRNQEQTLKTRHATIYNQIMAPIISPTGIKNMLLLETTVLNHEEWWELTRTNNEYFEAWAWLCNIFEMAGIYIREGVASIEFFTQHQPYWHLLFWRQNKPIIYKQREAWTQLLQKHGVRIGFTGEIL
jgi:hypothetical protein